LSERWASVCGASSPIFANASSDADVARKRRLGRSRGSVLPRNPLDQSGDRAPRQLADRSRFRPALRQGHSGPALVQAAFPGNRSRGHACGSSVGPESFARHSSAVRGFRAQDQEELRIGAAMAHVEEWGNLDGFPGSRGERLALMATATRRGLVAWDRSSDRYSLSARSRRYLDIRALPPTGGWPRSAGHSPRHKWLRRLRAASIGALACLGLAALGSTGTWRITSYFADPTFTEIKGRTAAPLAPNGHRGPSSPLTARSR
jgi:hypothetical protein